MKLIDTTHDEHNQTRLNYHDIKFDNDFIPYLNASYLKALHSLEIYRPPSKALTIGTKVHDLLFALATTGTYHVILQKGRKGSKETQDQAQEVADTYPEGSYIIATKADAEILEHALKVGRQFLDTCSNAKLSPELVLFASPEDIRRAKDIPPELLPLHEWIKASGCGVKAAIDLVVKPLGSTIHRIYDYKRTAKTTIPDILQQFHSLNYPFSMIFYRYVLALHGVEVDPIITLNALCPDLPAILPIQIDTSQPQIIDKYLTPMLHLPFMELKNNTESLYSGDPIQTIVTPNGYLAHINNQPQQLEDLL